MPQEAATITDEDILELYEESPSKSALIRNLSVRGLETKVIASRLLDLGILSPRSAYPHVRNVLTTPLKRQQQ